MAGELVGRLLTIAAMVAAEVAGGWRLAVGAALLVLAYLAVPLIVMNGRWKAVRAIAGAVTLAVCFLLIAVLVPMPQIPGVDVPLVNDHVLSTPGPVE